MSQKNLAELVRAEDLKRLRHIVYMKNETSQTSFSEADKITIQELGENFLVLEGPAKCCQSGHQVTLSLVPFKRKSDQKVSTNIHVRDDLLQLVAKVEEYTLLNNAEQRATWKVTLTQYNKDDGEQIRNLYEEHQKTINSLVGEKES